MTPLTAHTAVRSAGTDQSRGSSSLTTILDDSRAFDIVHPSVKVTCSHQHSCCVCGAGDALPSSLMRSVPAATAAFTDGASRAASGMLDSLPRAGMVMVGACSLSSQAKPVVPSGALTLFGVPHLDAGQRLRRALRVSSKLSAHGCRL